MTASQSAQSPGRLVLNLGGEAELPGVINQQPPWADLANRASRTGRALRDYLVAGEVFLFCDNRALPFPDGSVEEVVTNGVPVDSVTWLGPGVQSSEITRVLRAGGSWRHDGVVVLNKP